VSRPVAIGSPQLYPQFLISLRGDVWTVQAFMVGGPAISGWGYDGNLFLIGGPAADLLFMCLAGHRFGTPRYEASFEVAQAARAHMAAMAPEPGGYWIANRVVQHWGYNVWPEMDPGKRLIKAV
jgi:hypothetical protein